MGNTVAEIRSRMLGTIPLVLGALRELKDSFGEQWANKEKADAPSAAEVTD